MPIDAIPLFRPELLRSHLHAFHLPRPFEEMVAPLKRWATALALPCSDEANERQLLPQFLGDIFHGILGYQSSVNSPNRWTISAEKYVPVDGKYADAVLGEFRPGGQRRFAVALEGKGPRDPLDRPHAGRKMSAVDQGYRYSINLPCEWIIVTSMRQTRLYHKGSNQHTYERFDLDDLATNVNALQKFVYLLGADRVVPDGGECHFGALLAASAQVGQEVTRQYYQRYAALREEAFAALRLENAQVPAADVLRATQKLLDRVLFCCFAEDRGLLPPQTIHRAYEHRDPYHPRPIYENFRGLFAAIDKGSEPLQIPGYNGGLFALDPMLDGLSVPDAVCRSFEELARYDYRPGHQASLGGEAGSGFVDVDLLGHIFERSITDLERLHGQLAGREESVSRRKKEGAFYTPAFITRYLVSQALGGVLADRFEALRREHAAQAEGTAQRVLDDPRAYTLKELNRPQRDALIRFWLSWQDQLRALRILDPACGSGAFLIEAFD
jgi:hypothetical protein